MTSDVDDEDEEDDEDDDEGESFSFCVLITPFDDVFICEATAATADDDGVGQ